MLKSDLFILIYQTLNNSKSNNTVQIAVELTNMLISRLNIEDNVNLSDKEITSLLSKFTIPDKVAAPLLDKKSLECLLKKK